MSQLERLPEYNATDNEMYISHFRPTARKPVFKQRFLVRCGEKLVPVTSTEIAYFYAEDRWTYLITKLNERFLIDHKLRDLETMMHPDQFFRVSRGYLVASSSIVSLNPYLKGQLKVRLKPMADTEVIVSRTKTPHLKEWLDN